MKFKISNRLIAKWVGPLSMLAAGALLSACGANPHGTSHRKPFYSLPPDAVGEDYLNEVGKSLLPGNAAVVAEVWEEWTLPVDTKMEALGGVVFRSTRMEFVDDQMEKDIAALNADLDELDAEYAQASAEAKKKLQTRIDNTKAKLQAAQNAMKARLVSSQQEMEAKIQSLEKQVAKARGERKAKLEKRIAELKADQKRRSDLLKQAWELTKKALSD